LISGLVLGSFIGTLSMFVFLFMRWLPRSLAVAQHDTGHPIPQSVQQTAGKAVFRP
jgi:hypothetical protein